MAPKVATQPLRRSPRPTGMGTVTRDEIRLVYLLWLTKRKSPQHGAWLHNKWTTSETTFILIMCLKSSCKYHAHQTKCLPPLSRLCFLASPAFPLSLLCSLPCQAEGPCPGEPSERLGEGQLNLRRIHSRLRARTAAHLQGRLGWISIVTWTCRCS